MKRLLSFSSILFIVLTFLTACGDGDKVRPDTSEPVSTKQLPTELTALDKQIIEKEISDSVKAFFQQVEKMDIEGCMRFFENTPDFLAANMDGSPADYNYLKEINAGGFSQMSAFKNTMKKESIRVLSSTNVLYTIFATQEFTLKSGDKMKVDNVAATMLFNKINNAWKITYYHESAGQPVKIATK